MLKIIFIVLFIDVEQDSQGRLTCDEVIQQLIICGKNQNIVENFITILNLGSALDFEFQLI